MADISPAEELALALNFLVRECHGTARDKGWHDPEHPASFGDRVALVHSELSEALEEFRNGHAFDETYYTAKDNGDGTFSQKPEGIPAELADVVIRVCDMAGAYGIPLAEAIIEKMRFNATRPHRHGGKVI